MGTITTNILESYSKKFETDKNNRVAMRTVITNGLNKSAINVDPIRKYRNEFSLELKQGDITDQKMSGRCWMFAALNMMRYETIHNWNLENIEFSQTYPLFFDKLEKSNYFLEAILETLDEPLNGRLLAYLLYSPLNDGGQWDMFCNIVEKYGVVPKEAMPETAVSSKTQEMNYYLTAKLREYACILRKEHEKGKSFRQLKEKKEEMLYNIYKILCICLGEPPKEFDFEIRDKKDNWICDYGITPKKFYEKYIGLNLSEYVSLINAPTEDKPFNQCFTVKYLGNVKEGKKIHYLNLPMKELKEAAIAQMKNGHPVWFGADIDYGMLFQEGIVDTEVLRVDDLLGIEFGMTKAERLDYKHSMLNHAMLLTGANIDDDNNVSRWKIENSWGKEKGKEGYYIMSDRWFDEYIFQVVVNKKYLSDSLKELLDGKVTELEPWDPMGSLAQVVK